jgi:pilus assembly protein CpaB
MHNVSRIAAILLVVIATVLALAAFSMGRRAPSEEVAKTEPAPRLSVLPPVANAHVLVAAQKLPSGQAIRAESLRVAELSAQPDGSYAQPEQLIGQVPRVDIPEGSIITTSLLSNQIAMQLHAGERALAVPVDEITGIGSRVMPGDYVDVVLTLKTSETQNGVTLAKDRSQSRLLASRLRVLAYGARDLPATGSKQNAATNSAHPDQPEAPPRMAVLAVPLDDIDALVLGAQSGKLSLALRHPGDEGVPNDVLFPAPSPVLSPRGDLTAAQRTWLDTPENRAYAGVDDMGLVGKSKSLLADRRPRGPATSGVEIIRGSIAAAPHAQQTVTP